MRYTIGKPIILFSKHPYTVTPIMEIKAPKGYLVLWDKPDNVDEQCKCIRAFMEQHNAELDLLRAKRSK